MEKAGTGIVGAIVVLKEPFYSVICWRENPKAVDVSERRILIGFARHLPVSIKNAVPILPDSVLDVGPSWERRSMKLVSTRSGSANATVARLEQLLMHP